MSWSSWSQRSRLRRLSVVGLDVGPDVCSLVVLSGSSTHPDRVCCAERLNLPDGMVVQGEVRQSVELGLWLRKYLEVGDYQPELICIGLDSTCVSNHCVTLVSSLSPDDVVFQLQAEVQLGLPEFASEVCIDYSVEADVAPVGEQRYWVHAAPRLRVEALQRVAQLADLKVLAIEPRHEASSRTKVSEALVALSPASAALALQCDAAFGLALRAWQDEGVNFLPHRDEAQHVLRRTWLLCVAVCVMGGAFLAGGFAMVMASAADAQLEKLGDTAASTRAFDEVKKAHQHAKTEQDRRTKQALWIKTRQDLQAQSLQWSRVLSHAAHGVWVGSVKQQGSRWTVHGEALSSNHVQQLVKQLKALDIWEQSPELPQLQVMPAVSTTGLPVWQFRIEADLKVGA
jgi:Tfp pilus assembly protein PilN